MISTSIVYFIFLACTLAVFYISPAKYRNYVLILASLIFYMYAKLSYGLIIIVIIISNYLIGIKIGATNDKKLKTRFLYLSLLINLGILIYFKYWDFVIDSISLFSGNNYLKDNFFLTEVLLPLGLSYYIFQTIGYILDIYRGSLKAEKNFSRFSLFTLFFPKLLVGPIERAKNILPQLSADLNFKKDNITEGFRLITRGLFKKLVVADRISMYVDAVYSNIHQHNSLTFWVATLLYPIQVYADFSGYTDIAIGTAKLFGINLMDNFKQPLLAKNVSDFWRRWHISLSTWVNDYIYNPIVYKRRDWGNFGIGYALLISFIVIGVWHGASWNYLLFGVLQAFALIYEVLTRNSRKKISKKIPGFIYNSVSILLTFLFFTFSLIIFRTTQISDANSIISTMFSEPGNLFIDSPSTILFIILGIVIILSADIIREYKIFEGSYLSKTRWAFQHLSYALLLIYILIAGVFDGGQFIYFAF
jgi:D-alanyl-lipoteichoic acid acyltransferase DltB (MBOAT superfamily)